MVQVLHIGPLMEMTQDSKTKAENLLNNIQFKVPPKEYMEEHQNMLLSQKAQAKGNHHRHIVRMVELWECLQQKLMKT